MFNSWLSYKWKEQKEYPRLREQIWRQNFVKKNYCRIDFIKKIL